MKILAEGCPQCSPEIALAEADRSENPGHYWASGVHLVDGKPVLDASGLYRIDEQAEPRLDLLAAWTDTNRVLLVAHGLEGPMATPCPCLPIYDENNTYKRVLAEVDSITVSYPASDSVSTDAPR